MHSSASRAEKGCEKGAGGCGEISSRNLCKVARAQPRIREKPVVVVRSTARCPRADGKPRGRAVGTKKLWLCATTQLALRGQDRALTKKTRKRKCVFPLVNSAGESLNFLRGFQLPWLPSCCLYRTTPKTCTSKESAHQKMNADSQLKRRTAGLNKKETSINE